MAVSLNWVQQDYFSPQATVMLMLPGIFIVLGLSRNRPVGSMLLVILFATAAITHQLTPFWLFGAIGLLTITRNFHPWWLVIPLGAILVCQLIYNWDEVSRYQLFSGDILDNAKSNITRYGVEPVLGQRIVSYGNKALAGGLWLSTGLVIVYRMWKRQPFWAAAVLALSPMLLLGGQSYGGEAIFRVYLYSAGGGGTAAGRRAHLHREHGCDPVRGHRRTQQRDRGLVRIHHAEGSGRGVDAGDEPGGAAGVSHFGGPHLAGAIILALRRLRDVQPGL
jgi:hypothetical protein